MSVTQADCLLHHEYEFILFPLHIYLLNLDKTKSIPTEHKNLKKPSMVVCHSDCVERELCSYVCLTAVDSLEARVISRFPLRPSKAGTRMKISVMY